MTWEHRNGELAITVPIAMHFGMGEYEIHCVKRPHYCDRGDWQIIVDGSNDLDVQDGFPRYFFGTEEEVKKQMETWLSRRSAYKVTVRKESQ